MDWLDTILIPVVVIILSTIGLYLLKATFSYFVNREDNRILRARLKLEKNLYKSESEDRWMLEDIFWEMSVEDFAERSRLQKLYERNYGQSSDPAGWNLSPRNMFAQLIAKFKQMVNRRS